MPNSVRVLVVEDDADLRSMLVEALQHFGATTRQAESGSSALKILERPENEFDIVMSDVRMPDGDGIFLLKNFRKLNSKTPFVFLTGFSDLTEVEAKNLGAQVMLSKPINLRNLRAVLRDYASQAS